MGVFPSNLDPFHPSICSQYRPKTQTKHHQNIY